MDYWLVLPPITFSTSFYSICTIMIFQWIAFSIQIKLIDTISEMADRYDNGCANHIILTGPNGLRNHRVTVEEEHRTGLPRLFVSKIAVISLRKWHIRLRAYGMILLKPEKRNWYWSAHRCSNFWSRLYHKNEGNAISPF